MGGLDRHAVETLVFTEARLLDEGRYADWLDLYAEDATYWMPSWISETATVTNTDSELSYLFLDRAGLADFVVRMESGTAHVAHPPARTTRLIGNILADPDNPGLYRARWMLHLSRRGVDETFSGSCEYRLRATADRLLIAAKKVIVINEPVRSGRLPVV